MTTVIDSEWLRAYPMELFTALAELSRLRELSIYLAGGSVRDRLMGIIPRDLDFTVQVGAVAFARELAARLGAGFVLLDQEEDVARVVWQGLTLDFSGFRKHSTAIEADLRQRDFTINALAVLLVFDGDGRLSTGSLPVIDPTGGIADLAAGLVRCPHPDNLLDDPLRMLRAYRFCAIFDFSIEPASLAAISSHGARLSEVAGERIAWEAGLIMASPRAAKCWGLMLESGLFFQVFPELAVSRGLSQPSSHHLDVLGHSLEALRAMEDLLSVPESRFPGHCAIFTDYLAVDDFPALLKWAALFHDLGKAASFALRQGRITFYNHDRVGAELAEGLARRLHWRREHRQRLARLIALHMWPFHLNNARAKNGISRRACLRLVKAVGDDLPGLFLLAMADSLAGRGPGKPVGMEESLAELFGWIYGVYRQHIQPVFASPPLVSGHDLIRDFSLPPGPLFRQIFDGLEQARVEGQVQSREQAMTWVRAFLDGQNDASKRDKIGLTVL